MQDTLSVIRRAISEHHAIKEHIKLTGDTVNDIEALITIQRAYAQWTQSSIADLTEKQSLMQQKISFLEQGLRNHFAFEEEVLPPLLGELLVKAIIHEHNMISRQIERAKTTLLNINFEGLEQKELLSKKSQIQEIIDHINQTVEEHIQHEEVILSMMEKYLEANKA